MSEIVLRTAEARPKDVGRGRVKISGTNMQQINVTVGDVVEIQHKDRKTGSIVWLADKEDQKSDIIRIDGILRRNLGVKLGEHVKVRRADTKIAKEVVIRPVEDLNIDNTLKQYVKQKLLGYPVTNNDMVLVQLLGQAHRFVIDNITPENTISLITDTTTLVFNEKPRSDRETSSQIYYEDIGGMSPVIQRVREMVELPLRYPELFKKLGISPPKGVLLHGPPGTGKTLIAKAVANESEAFFTAIQGPEIMSKFYGESEAKLREIFKKAEENPASIIFIDEIDAIASKRDETTGEVERRVVAQILSLMDGMSQRGNLVVIGATNRANALDPALRRPGRFDREIAINVPDQAERLEILQIHTRRMPGIEKVNIENLSKLTYGFVGADLAALAREAAMNALRDVLSLIDLDHSTIPPEVIERLEVTNDHFLSAMKEIQPSAVREVFAERPNLTMESVGGLENIIQVLKEVVEWPLTRKESFEQVGIVPPKGILLYGPPGTGKTLVASAIAAESRANFIAVKGPQLLSKWVGESEKGLREIFRKARMASPTIIFFDEIDALARKRTFAVEGASNTWDSLLSQLLTEIDGIEPFQNVILIAATNRPDVIDSALLRPGRFDRVCYVEPPNTKEREKILELYTQGMPLGGDVDIPLISKQTLNYTGADLQSLCREAAFAALRESPNNPIVLQSHLMEALEVVGPSLSEQILEFYKQFDKKFRNRLFEESLTKGSSKYEFL